MLRVCLVGLIAGGHSGIPRYAAALSAGLDRVAPEFPDLSLRLLTTPRGAAAAGVERLPVERVEGRFAHAYSGPRRILADQVLARSADADLLHFFDLTGPVLAPRTPFVATIHDAAAVHGFEPVRMAYKRILQPWAVRRARAVVAVSAFARAEAVRMLRADPTRVRVIHSGPGLLARTDDTAPTGSRYVLYVGNLAVHKNLPFLVDAFGAAGVDARLLLVGSRGDRFHEVRAAIEASPARDRIEVRTDADDAEVDRLYRGATMLALPSRYEGFGFTALEAMARGCPVLASDIPALREVSGAGAMLLPTGQRDAWAHAIRRVFFDRGVREELRRRGRATASLYSWERTGREICELLREVGRGLA